MDLEAITTRLASLEDAREREETAHAYEAWPAEAIAFLQQQGCFRSVIPRALGGLESTPEEQLAIYEAVGKGSMACALVLTQHDGACELIRGSDNEPFAADLLPRVARGEALATVGISQLTTSRRGSGPAMNARAVGERRFRLDGLMPWVTSVGQADWVVTGAVLEDGNQVLGCVPMRAAGVEVGTPLRLMALTHSCTGEMRCEGTIVEPDHWLRGPMEKVLAIRAPVKPLAVSAVGTGLAGALVDRIEDRRSVLGEHYDEFAAHLRPAYDAARKRLYNAAQVLSDPGAEVPSMDIRVAVNALLCRLASTCLVVAKGSGFVAGHPAQRLVREAMFFLVWSAPTHVQIETLRKLW